MKSVSFNGDKFIVCFRTYILDDTYRLNACYIMSLQLLWILHVTTVKCRNV